MQSLWFFSIILSILKTESTITFPRGHDDERFQQQAVPLAISDHHLFTMCSRYCGLQ